MATNGGSINYTVKYNIDKTGLNQMKASLQEIFNLSKQDLIKINSKATDADLAKLKASAKEVESALERAFNPNLGTLNVSKFNQELKKLDVKRIYQDFNIAGQAGRNAFRNITSDILTTNMQLKQTHTLLDNMATTMANTIKWGVASSVMNTFTGSVQQAYGYIKNLDSSLNDIRIVTNKSADEMAKFAVQANKAAKELGASTTSYTDASLIYYQQGLTDAEVAARAEVTLKAANVTGQSADAVSEQLTAVWNGYKVSAEEAELYIDKLAAVAATTASDLEELSVGMSKVASAASVMGVDVDQLNAQLATIVSVTRQAPESVGTALKTIYARMGDIEAGLDGETSLSNYTEQMAQMGYDVLDANGKLRDMGEVIEEIGNNWKNMSREQQISLSQTVAGTRQYNNLLALFDNWGMYTKAIETSGNAAGTLQEQQDIYMDRTVAHLQQLRTATEDLYDSLFETKSFNNLLDGIIGAVDLLGNFADAIGGGGNALLLLGTIGTQVFSKQIAAGLATTIMNFQTAKENATQLSAEMEILNQFDNVDINDSRTQRLIEMKRQQLDLTKSLTAEERNISNEFIQQQNELYKEEDALKALADEASVLYEHLTGDIVQVGPKGEGSEDLAVKLAKESEEFKVYIDEVNGVRTSINELTKARNEYDKAGGMTLSKDSEQAIKYKEAIDKTKHSIRDYISQMGKLKNSYKLADEDQQKLIKAYDDLIKVVGNVNSINLKNGKHVAALKEYYKATGDAVNHTGAKIKQLSGDMEHLSSKLENNQEHVTILTQRWNNFIQTIDLRNKIQQFTTLLGKVGQVASGVRTLSQITEIWNNQDLSTGEKFLQITTSLTMGLPMLINGLMQGVTTYKTLTDSIRDYIAITKIKQTVDKSILDLTNARSVKDALLIAFQKAGIELTQEEVAGLTVETAAELANAKAKENVALKGQIEYIARQKNIASIYKEIAARTLLNPWFWAAAAGIAAVTGAVWLAVKAHNAEQEAAQDAAESLSVLTERYNDLSSSVDNFKSKISSYQEGIIALSELEKGTEEYRKKLEETNQVAKELIETYGLFNKYKIIDDKIILDPNAVQQALIDQQNALNTVSINKNFAQIDTNNKKVNEQIANFRDTSGLAYEAENTWSAFSDEQIKQISEGFYQAYSNNNGIYDDKTTKAFNQVLQDIIPNLNQIGFQLENVQDKFVELGKTIYDTSNANNYYAKEAAATALKMKYGADIIAAIEVEKTKDGKSVSYEGRESAFTNAIANQIANEVANSDIFKEAKKSSTENALNHNYGYNIKNDKQLAIEYAKTVLGYTQEEVAKMSYKKGIGKGSLTLNGEVVDGFEADGISDKIMRAGLAQAAMAKQATEEMLSTSRETIISNFAEIANKTDMLAEGAGATITNAILNSMDYTLENGGLDFSSSFASMSPFEYENLKKATEEKTPEELRDLFGLTDENLKAMGYDAGGNLAEQFQIAFKEQLKNYEEFGKAAYEQSEINAINQDAASEGLDVEALNEYADTLAEIADESEIFADELAENEIASQQVAKQITKLNRGIDELGSNWENWSTILKNSDKGSQEYSEALNGVKKALADVADTSEEYISNDFIQEHYEDVKLAAEGNADAIDRLRIALADEIVAKIVLDNELSVGEVQTVTDAWNSLSSQLQDIEVGVMLSGEESLITSLNEMVASAQMTTAQVNDLLGSMGFTATFAKEPQVVETKIPEYTTYHSMGDVSYQTIGTGENARQIPTWSEISWTEQTGEHIATGEAAAWAMSTDGTVPKIETITKSSSGKTNNYSSSNKGGTKKPGGKSGGGNSKPDKMDSNKDKVDIYHDINMEIKSLSNEIEKLGKKENKLFGQQLIDNLNEQLGVLQAQTEAYKEKIELAKKEAALYRSNLASQGVSFDSQGNVTNYIAAMQGKQDYLNSLIAKYNAMSKTEQEKFKETVEQAKKDYDQFKTDMEYYENLVSDTIPDLEAQIQDAMDKQIEIQIQKFTMEVEIRLEMAEAERDWNEFKKKIIDDIDDDDILGNAMAKMLDFDSYYKDSGKGIVQALTKQVNGTLDQLHQIDETGTSSVYGDNKAQAMEDLQKYYTELMQQLEDVKDLQDEIKDAYLDMIDEANEKFDAQIEKYETITELIEHNMNVVELLNGDDAYDQLAKYYELQERNNLKQLDFHRQEVAFWRERMDSVEEGSEEWDAYRENWQEAVNELNESVSASIENLIAKYQNTVSGIFEDLNDKVTGGKGLDYVKEEWDLINKNADQYLDTINSAFAIRELEGKYLDALDNTDSISAQRQLNDMMNEQLNMLRAKDKLTQYDVDRANALYEIELKKIALQEAQQNKSQMRLRRDAQGNYSYQYVADQDAIGNAEDELASAQNSLYNMDKEQYRTNLDEIYEMYVEFQDKLNELYMDNTLSDIEREEQKKLLVEQYGELINGLVEQNEDIRLNLQESALQAYADFQGELLMEDIVPQWDSSVQEMADKFAGEGGFIPTCQDSLIELDEATADYEDSLEDLEDTAGITFDEIEDGLDKNIDLTYDFIDANDELIDKYGEQLNAIEDVWHEVQVLTQKYEEAERAAIAATEAAYKYWQTAKAMAADGIDGGPSYSGGLNTSGYSGGGDYPSGGGSIPDKTENTPSNKIPNTSSGSKYYIVNGSGSSWSGIGSDGAHGNRSSSSDLLKEFAKKVGYTKWTLNGSGLASLKTGGYTGSWTNGDKDGKLALLHQKELVLNSEDTKNILSAVDIVRSIGASMRDRINSLTSRFNNNNNIANNGMVIEQKVSIDARFEGQTESSQIETALINLVNYASQHAYDTTR